VDGWIAGGKHVQQEAWRTILGMLCKTIVYGGCSSKCGRRTGVSRSCFDALFEGVSRVPMSEKARAADNPGHRTRSIACQSVLCTGSVGAREDWQSGHALDDAATVL
jgi:hypothetical protein